jgi:hypothetical protein
VATEELARTLRPGGVILVAFHVGEHVRHLETWFDEEVDVDFRFLQTEPMARLLESAGFDVEAALERGPYPQEAATQRAYILARRTGRR